MRPSTEILKSFTLPGTLISCERFGRGHIHKTYLSRWRDGAQVHEFILQWLNQRVFTDVAAVMANIEIVTQHLRTQIDLNPPTERFEVLTLVPTRGGDSYLKTAAGEIWRTYHVIPNVLSSDICQSPKMAYEAARLSGNFLYYLKDLEPTSLKVTIPHFMDSRYRLEQLSAVIRANPKDRVKEVGVELSFVDSWKSRVGSLMTALERGDVPTRVTHQDLKINNILFDETSGKAVSLVDLDTCMPGTLLFDFGDLIRSTTVSCSEDEMDLNKVVVSREYLKSAVIGFMEGTKGTLTSAEKILMPTAPPLLAMTLGVRFLADYINGDTYFGAEYPTHNLVRARTQFRVAQELEISSEFIRTAASQG